MHLKSKSPVVLLLIVMIGITRPVFSQFSGTKAHDYIKKMCEPEFRGRKTGEPGSHEAAEWIGARFKEWGLQPGGDNGTYIQEFPMLVTTQRKPARIKLENGLFGPEVYTDGNDFVLYFNSGSGKAKTEVIFAGYGICAPDAESNPGCLGQTLSKVKTKHPGTRSVRHPGFATGTYRDNEGSDGKCLQM